MPIMKRAYCSLTKIDAMPIPEPIHMLVQKILPPVCFAMLRPVATCLAPAARKHANISMEIVTLRRIETYYSQDRQMRRTKVGERMAERRVAEGAPGGDQL